ncbi:MAG: extracellular solute-binding protein [Lachnospiraceae bacterium]
MKSRGRKTVQGLVVAMMCMLVGCQNIEQNPEGLIEQDVTTLEWYVNYSWYTANWGDSVVSKEITDNTGVAIEFITPVGSENTALNAKIASGNLPDIITLGWWESQVSTLVEGEYVYALNELADMYDLYFYEVADPTVIDWNTMIDGNLYYYPNSFYTPEDYEEDQNIASNINFLVRQDIYEAIGSPDMTTPQGFYEAVKMATELFPQVDGKDLIPIGSYALTVSGCVSFDEYLMDFLAIPYEVDGVYYDRYTDSEYITWLKLFRQLAQEGYLSEEIFIDQRTQLEEKAADGRYFCMMIQGVDIEAQQNLLSEKTQGAVYIAVDGPKNSSKDDPVLPGLGTNGWTVTMISKSCENPDVAISFLTYLMSEEAQKLLYLGVEGEMYEELDGEVVIYEEVSSLLETNRASYDQIYGGNNTYWMLQDSSMQLQWLSSFEDTTNQFSTWAFPYTQYLGQYEISFSFNTSIAYLDGQINTLWSETLPMLIFAKTESEFDEVLATFVEERNALGYDRYIDYCTQEMNKNKERLGIQ